MAWSVFQQEFLELRDIEKSLSPSTSRASICSVTLIVPICAAIAPPARLATMSPLITGANSLAIESATTGRQGYQR